jgi:protein-S-isoprenylcysteine O-methyltransferase Ste14
MKTLWLCFKTLLYTLVVAGFAAGWAPLKWFERRPRWPEVWQWPQWAGLGLVLLGAALYAHGAWVFAVRGQGTPSFFDPPKKLTRRGPYKWVRNPMYLALFAVVAGEGVFLWSWHIGVYLVCLVCLSHLLVVMHEENALRYRFGAIYEDYKREVPRWFPRKPKPVLETVAPFETRR